MRRSWIASCAALVGCGFPAAGGDDTADVDAPPGVIDAAVNDGKPTADARGQCGGEIWSTDFSSDPTQLDVSGDGTNDWALRDGSVFPTGELTPGGTWLTPSAGVPLDTQPRQPFLDRTIVDVRMRNVDTCCAKGAVFWINVGYDGTGFIPIYVDVKRIGNGSQQRIEFLTKDAGGTEQVIEAAVGLPTGFIDIHLEIDAGALTLSYSGGGLTGMHDLVRQASTTSMDSWGTVVAYSSASEFDSVTVEVCPAD